MRWLVLLTLAHCTAKQHSVQLGAVCATSNECSIGLACKAGVCTGVGEGDASFAIDAVALTSGSLVVTGAGVESALSVALTGAGNSWPLSIDAHATGSITVSFVSTFAPTLPLDATLTATGPGGLLASHAVRFERGDTGSAGGPYTLGAGLSAPGNVLSVSGMDASTLGGVPASQFSRATTRTMNLSVYSVSNVYNGAQFAPTGAIASGLVFALPTSGGSTPNVTTSFTLPPDYAPSGAVTFNLTGYRVGSSGACNVSLAARTVSRVQVGLDQTFGDFVPDDGNATFSIDQNVVVRRVFRVNDNYGPLSPGDTFSFIVAASFPATPCTGLFVFTGFEVTYAAL